VLNREQVVINIWVLTIKGPLLISAYGMYVSVCVCVCVCVQAADITEGKISGDTRALHGCHGRPGE
jgi:hypothetical protein